MSALFKKPKIPAPTVQEVKPPPTIDEAAMRDEQARKFRRRKGALATSTAGGSATPSVAVKTLLG